MNNGMKIWQSKHEKQRKKRYNVTDEQVGVCRFVNVKFNEYKRTKNKKGKNKIKFDKRNKGKGLQIENKVYFSDGSFKYVNGRNFKITVILDEIPEWANEFLINKYLSLKN